MVLTLGYMMRVFSREFFKAKDLEGNRLMRCVVVKTTFPHEI